MNHMWDDHKIDSFDHDDVYWYAKKASTIENVQCLEEELEASMVTTCTSLATYIASLWREMWLEIGH